MELILIIAAFIAVVIVLGAFTVFLLKDHFSDYKPGQYYVLVKHQGSDRLYFDCVATRQASFSILPGKAWLFNTLKDARDGRKWLSDHYPECDDLKIEPITIG